MQYIPRHAKNDLEMGRAKFLRNLLDFMNVLIVNIERLASNIFKIAVTETLYFFYIQFYPADCEDFCTSFLKFMCPQ